MTDIEYMNRILDKPEIQEIQDGENAVSGGCGGDIVSGGGGGVKLHAGVYFKI